MSSTSMGVLGSVIPDDIGSVTQLTRLDFSNNSFQGTTPRSVSNCRNLRYLSLQNNRLGGEIPDLSELAYLQILLLADNQLTGWLPRELGEQSSLVIIDVSQNNLSVRIPSLVNCLLKLWLCNNSFIVFKEPMYINAPNLLHFRVSDNHLEGSNPVAITNLSNLKVLDMSRNRLSSKVLSGLSNLKVSVISLAENQLSGSIPVDLLQPPSDGAQEINISFNHL